MERVCLAPLPCYCIMPVMRVITGDTGTGRADLVPVIDGTLVPRPGPGSSVRDVDAARWDEDEDARELAVRIWLRAKTSEHTRLAYRGDITLWFAWCDEEDVPIADARRGDVDEWRDSMDGAPATIARRLSAVSSFYDYWLSEDVVSRNPAKRASRPKVSSAPRSIRLTRRQAGQLLAHVDQLTDPRPAVIVRLLAETGMRVSELCGARVTDLGLSGGHHVLTITRKGGTVQQLPVAASTWARVDAYLGGRAGGYILEVARTERRRSDGRMDRSYVRQLLRRTARAAGLPAEVWEHMHPHVLRHSAATLLAEDNVPVHEIQALLGHADLRTTQRYIHHAQELDASPVYRLAALLARRTADDS
jgi:integrase/recombinase XerD